MHLPFTFGALFAFQLARITANDVTLLGTFAATVIAAVAAYIAYVTGRGQRIVAAVQVLLQLAPQWTEQSTVEARAHLARQALAQSTNYGDLNMVLDIYEQMGGLVRERLIPLGLVWRWHSEVILAFDQAYRGLIDDERQQQRDDTLWEDFTWLADKLRRVNRKRGAPLLLSPDHLHRFLADEASQIVDDQPGTS
jgi:hypothetical protein